MATPIFVLAGQSNAWTLSDEIKDALTAKYGANGYVLVEAHSPGSPLTFQYSNQDWATQGELPSLLAANTIAALNNNPGSTVEGFIWVQGEADSYSFVNADIYDQRFWELMQTYQSTVDAAVGGNSGLGTADIVISTLADAAPGGSASNRANWEEVQLEHQQIANASPFASVVDPDQVAASSGTPTNLMFRDDLHYSNDFSVTLANALVDAASSTASIDTPVMDLPDTGDKGEPTPEPVSSDDGFTIANNSVTSSGDFSLRDHSQNLDNLTLTGGRNINGIGNSRDNVITGNNGNNHLDGAWGNDTLIGGGGADTLEGSRGDDTYVVDDFGDRVIEAVDRGHDTVESSVSFVLRDHSNHLEDLTLTGSGDNFGTGNWQNNVITGNDGNNILDGAWGNDTLDGGRGNDTLIGGNHEDVFVLGPENGVDMILGFEHNIDKLQIQGQDFDAPGAQSRQDFLAERATIQDQDLYIDLGDGHGVYLDEVIDDSHGTNVENYFHLLW